MPVAYPQYHVYHFNYLRELLAYGGIVLDDAPKNICSLRGYSYDEGAYFNHHATPLELYVGKSKCRSSSKVSPSAYQHKAEKLLAQIEREGKDVTKSYKAWFTIGCNIAATFGDEGRDYYHRVSRFHPGYTIAATDRKYNQCLQLVRDKNSRPGLGYWLGLCG